MRLKGKLKKNCNKPKKQRCSITLEEKLKIIRMYENGKTISTIARDINRPVSTVNTIVKDKVRIIENVKDEVSLKDTIITKKRIGPIAEMEKLLSHWIQYMTQKRIALSSLIIQEKARSLHKDLQEKAGITDTKNIFKASAGWYERFKKRTNLHIKVTGATANQCKVNKAKTGVKQTGPKTLGIKKFTTSGLAETFKLVDRALAKLESMDPNTERFKNVSGRILSEMSVYKDIYDDKNKRRNNIF